MSTMNVILSCAKRGIHALLICIVICVLQSSAFNSPLGLSSTRKILRYGKARQLSNKLHVAQELSSDDIIDVGVYNQPTIQRSTFPAADEAIGIGLSSGSPSNRQVTKSSRFKGIDWTYEMDVELFSLHWRYKQKHHEVEDVDWVEIAEELNEPGVYSNECLERYEFLHTDEYEKFVMNRDGYGDED